MPLAKPVEHNAILLPTPQGYGLILIVIAGHFAKGMPSARTGLFKVVLLRKTFLDISTCSPLHSSPS